MNEDGDVVMRGLIQGNRIVFTRGGTAFYRRLPDPGQSLSGKRRSSMGLASRLDVMERLARMLAERAQLAQYAEPLRAAFRDVLNDCPPDLPVPADRTRVAIAALPAQKRCPHPERLVHPGRPGGEPQRGFAPRAPEVATPPSA